MAKRIIRYVTLAAICIVAIMVAAGVVWWRSAPPLSSPEEPQSEPIMVDPSVSAAVESYARLLEAAYTHDETAMAQWNDDQRQLADQWAGEHWRVLAEDDITIISAKVETMVQQVDRRDHGIVATVLFNTEYDSLSPAISGDTDKLNQSGWTELHELTLTSAAESDMLFVTGDEPVGDEV